MAIFENWREEVAKADRRCRSTEVLCVDSICTPIRPFFIKKRNVNRITVVSDLIRPAVLVMTVQPVAGANYIQPRKISRNTT